MPSVGAPRVDVHLVARDETEVLTRASHAPEKITVTCGVHANGRAIGQNNIQLPYVVAHHAVQTLLTAVATPEARSEHTDAVTSTRCSDKALVPEVLDDVACEEAASEPCRLATGLYGDAVQPLRADLYAVESIQGVSPSVTAATGQEVNTVSIAVFDLRWGVSRRGRSLSTGGCSSSYNCGDIGLTAGLHH